MGRLIDADNLKKDIAKLHVLHDEKEIRRLYYANPHTSLADFEEILVRIFDAIEAAPTIDVPTWIPCSERLPSEETSVLVTFGYGEIGIDIHTVGWANNSWVWHDDAIAWMPLPKPYEEKDHE